MAKDKVPAWSVSKRRFANVVGLDPEAEWLIGDEKQRESVRLFLPTNLSNFYESYAFPLRTDPRADETIPFTFVISPEPGGLSRTTPVPEVTDQALRGSHRAHQRIGSLRQSRCPGPEAVGR